LSPEGAEYNSSTRLLLAVKDRFQHSGQDGLNAVSDFLHSEGKASEALLYSALFSPDLVLLNDSVLLAWMVPDDKSKASFKRLSEKASNSLWKLESSYNFVEVGYLFDASGRDTSDEEDELLAVRIRDAWRGWLKVTFPNRCFSVEVLSPEITGSCVGVRFFELR